MAESSLGTGCLSNQVSRAVSGNGPAWCVMGYVHAIIAAHGFDGVAESDNLTLHQCFKSVCDVQQWSQL